MRTKGYLFHVMITFDLVLQDTPLEDASSLISYKKWNGSEVQATLRLRIVVPSATAVVPWYSTVAAPYGEIAFVLQGMRRQVMVLDEGLPLLRADVQ